MERGNITKGKMLRSTQAPGDSPRRSISIDEWGTKWEKIFGKKKTEEKKD